MEKLGLIAGGGRLPIELAAQCEAAGRPYYVIRLAGFAENLDDHPGIQVGIGEFGRCIKTLKDQGCTSICFAGSVSRPDFSALKADLRGIKALPGLISSARSGDDALLRKVMEEFQKEGFKVEGAHEVATGLTLPVGLLGAIRPLDRHQEDIERAVSVARELGRMDVGQAAVVSNGLVLALEAQEGTDAMLGRVAMLPAAIRGSVSAPAGVLAKMPKPIQDLNIDLPTIGLMTVHSVAKAGLCGIVGEAGRLLVLDRDAVIEAADQLGIFILGLGTA